MSEQPSAMLFCPPQAPVSIARDATISIGRHSDCDLTVVRNAVSRRHAEISWDGSQYRLQDLGSRNGTFVNGSQVEGSVRLASGDRIDIGPATITFCEIGAGVGPQFDTDSMNDAATVYFERAPASAEAFQGSLAEIPAFAVFQVLEMGGKTGVLSIQWKGDEARIWFDNGAPVHAECEKQVGADAAMSLINAREGSFTFESQPISVDPTIRASITELLLEACRLEDEAAAER